MEKMIVNNKEYLIVRLLGKGKGGYSYLGIFEGTYVVVKKIHHEPCSYYQFGNKIEAESNDYKRLLEIGKILRAYYENNKYLSVGTLTPVKFNEIIYSRNIYDNNRNSQKKNFEKIIKSKHEK